MTAGKDKVIVMKRFVNTAELSKEEWLRYRKQGITGTDAAAICGMNPYSSAFKVYMDKTSDDIEDIDNEAMRQGRDLEEYVARRFMEETGLKVRRANAIFQSEEHPIMLADFDRIITGMPDGSRAGLECKTVSPYSSDKWKDGAIPEHYQLQVQHYLAVSGFDCWFIAALIFGNKFLIRKIERDEELISNLITIEERFWNENIVAGIMPEPDGTDSYSEIISKMYFNADKNKVITLDGCNGILERRQEIDSIIKKLEKEKNAIDQSVKLKMQDASVGMTDEFKVTWSSFESNRLDSKKLKEEQPELYDRYCRLSKSRRFTVTSAA